MGHSHYFPLPIPRFANQSMVLPCLGVKANEVSASLTRSTSQNADLGEIVLGNGPG